MKDIDVFGIGNPLIDLLSHVSSDFLRAQGLEKDRMYLVDYEGQKEIISRLEESGSEILHAPGGSCANSMIGLCQLGGTAAYSGKIGFDKFGKIYKEKLEAAAVESSLAEGDGPTGSSLILVPEDGSRTMNTHLGISQKFHVSDVSEALLRRSQFLYIEGYLWDTEEQKEAILLTIAKARQYGVKISLSLSDPFCVDRHAEEFNTLLKENVDMVFCNQEEAFGLTNTNISQEALYKLGDSVETVVMTLGSKGALIFHENEMTYVDSFSVEVIDTTGGGDAFAAGFLYGITHGKSASESGRIASALAALIINQLGPRVQGDWEPKLKELLG
ncbi:MAG: adenosine kinase [SAR324 cluster bacterium]|nr:adenosine kinase [SAR324 cluster bacterium]